MGDDLRLAGRVLRRFKLYSVASMITVALGIGAATAVFSVIDATLFGRCRTAIRTVWWS